ncbi:hypothetical protein BDD12DRAFT_897042 [Trichophaea hybrida]|nr:hypothetical protein BDD12DRAFT_897042 [Trichophaea hybrida]
MVQQVLEHEAPSRITSPRSIDSIAFQHLLGRVIHYALSLLQPEWKKALQLKTVRASTEGSEFTHTALQVTAGTCITCPLPLRLGLPCRHFMLPAAQTGTPVPLSLLHPWWWLDGPAVVPATLKMEYTPPGLSQTMSVSENTQITLPLARVPPSASEDTLYTYHPFTPSLLSIAPVTVRSGESEFDSGSDLTDLSEPEVCFITPPRTHGLIPKKIKGRAAQRALTGCELAERRDTQYQKAS